MSSPSFTPASPSFTPTSPSSTPMSPSCTPASPSNFQRSQAMYSPVFRPTSPSVSQYPQALSSPSFTPASPSASQHLQATSFIPSYALQTPNYMNGAAVHTARQFDNLEDDPTQRSTGKKAKVLNDRWSEGPRRSVVQEMLQMQSPHLLIYYEDRRTGKIEADDFEELKDPEFGEKAERLYLTEHGKVQHVFFEMDYNRGFSGRGVSPESMERPGLVGPRNEGIEEIVPPAGGLGYEQVDRPLWQAIDNKSGILSEGSKDEEEVGPFGESRDDLDVVPLGELYTESVSMMPGVSKDSGAAFSPLTVTAFPNEPQVLPTSSLPPLASNSYAPSRKRARDAEDDEVQSQQKRSRMDDGLGIVRRSASQQNRSRMDDILGIVRNDAIFARGPQSVGTAMTLDEQQSRKRARSPDDHSEDSTTGPRRKRVRLYSQPREIRNAEEEYVADGHIDTAIRDHSTLAHQLASGGETQGPAMVDRVANTEVDTRASVVEGPFANDEANGREDAVVGNQAVPSRTDWNTAHDINSDCANIRVRGMGVYDVTGEEAHLYIPTSRGSPDRGWTDDEKEDLRVYIQDYSIRDWTVLSQSMNRTVTELQNIYREILIGRNKLAGRPECAGIPREYPDLTPPPPPKDPAKQQAKAQPADTASTAELPEPVQDSHVVLRPLDGNGFPKSEQDCAREIEEGEIEEDDCPAKRVPASAQIWTGRRSKTFSRRGVDRRAGHQVRVADLKEEQGIEREGTREKVSSPESTDEERCPLNASVGKVVDPEGEGDVGQEQPLPAPSRFKYTSTKGPLGLNFAGVRQLSGSWRCGVPRHAAALRKRS